MKKIMKLLIFMKLKNEANNCITNFSDFLENTIQVPDPILNDFLNILEPNFQTITTRKFVWNKKKFIIFYFLDSNLFIFFNPII